MDTSLLKTICSALNICFVFVPFHHIHRLWTPQSELLAKFLNCELKARHIVKHFNTQNSKTQKDLKFGVFLKNLHDLHNLEQLAIGGDFRSHLPLLSNLSDA